MTGLGLPRGADAVVLAPAAATCSGPGATLSVSEPPDASTAATAAVAEPLSDFIRSLPESTRALFSSARSLISWIAVFTLVHFLSCKVSCSTSGSLERKLSIGSRKESSCPLAL
jgi:hypothetical protein